MLPLRRAEGGHVKAIDWFCGIGGFTLGLERAGVETVAACEIDANPRSVYARHFGEPTWKDIRHVGPDEIPAADLWTAGFPCQDVSAAGFRRGLDGKRSGLVWSLLGLAAELRPRWVLLENVPGILVRESGFGRLLGALADLGYGWSYRVLDSQYLGVAQRRKRVYVLACLDPGAGRERSARVLLEPAGLPRPSRASLAQRPSSAGGPARGPGGRRPPAVAHCLHTATGTKLEVCDTYIPFDPTQATHRENRSRFDPGAPCHTLPANGHPPHVAYSFYPDRGGGNNLRACEADRSPCLGTNGGTGTDRGIHVVGEGGAWVRRLTPTECERLQGFPDGWTEGLSSRQRYKALGNSVTVPVVEWIACRLAHEVATHG